jgi:hypothetical protein
MAQGGGNNGGLFNRLAGAFKRQMSGFSLDGRVISGRTAVDMPEVKLATLHKTVLTCNTGPGAGLTNIGQSVDGSNPNESINRGR